MTRPAGPPSPATKEAASDPEQAPLRVAFLHPDLGIGGAERLVVDAAVGLQNLGHKVVMFTSHHDPAHCFEETRDGTLTVRVGGNTIVPRTIMGRFYIVCAILRNLHLAWIILMLSVNSARNSKDSSNDEDQFDVIFVDQLSVSIPLLRWTGAKIFFYCHFPDKLLTKRESFLKKLYRVPVDFIEELTTGMADTIVVNSKFTANIFKESFKMLRQVPEVLYPSILFDKFDRTVDETLPEIKVLESHKITFLSINRYERKKDINLAVNAFARLLKESGSQSNNLRLVIAGGYDTRVPENVEHHLELVQLAEKHSLKTFTLTSGQTDTEVPATTQVLFLQSISDAQKLYLLQQTRAILYTPTNEHFGIVPVEAMYMHCPVVAVNSGGPTESVLDGITGYLRAPEEKVWADALVTLTNKTERELKMMGQAGHDRVVSLFSLDAFVSQLNGILMRLQNSSKEPQGPLDKLRPVILFSVIAVFLSILFYR
ncbi:alpha-1,3/alpha-1,6-mannosyltransferase [Entomortierella parvispora]|uniref:Alpha-1,3/1,6-mannosyltransferase ALG2 n=1 Tax=Entomortierella parvispora TaxID=205924 RepID=A0A9P3H7A7_9FUNG|nr:alpha-1,3/alpha-1,6-mannosyltransferase [Entomortierella parvispora]